MPRRSLDPKLDVVFKLLFAARENRDLLRSLLTAALAPPSPIEELDVLNPEVRREHLDDKGLTLDIHARFRDGSHVDVEMQSRKRGGRRERALYHWARLFGSQLVRGDLHLQLERCVVVWLVDYEEVPNERFHHRFIVQEAETGDWFSDCFELHFVELPKAQRSTQAGREPALELWARFLEAKSDDELEALVKSHPELEPAKHALDRLSEDREARIMAEERERAYFNWQLDLSEARQEGRQDGLREGLQEGRREERRALVRRQLERKFGALSTGLLARLEDATYERLEQYAERLLDATSLAEVFGD